MQFDTAVPLHKSCHCSAVLSIQSGIDLIEEVEGRWFQALDGKNHGESNHSPSPFERTARDRNQSWSGSWSQRPSPWVPEVPEPGSLGRPKALVPEARTQGPGPKVPDP